MRLVLVLLFCLTPLIFAESDNPFADEEIIESVEDTAVAEVVVDTEVKEQKKLPFWYGYVLWQKKVHSKLSALINSLKSELTAGKVLMILLISFLYSILHTAGPGHGKVILGNYFLTTENEHQNKDAVKAGLIVSITHVGSATLLSLFIVLIMKSVTRGAQDGQVLYGPTFFAGVLITVTGVVQLLNTYFHDSSEKFLFTLLKGFRIDVRSLGWHAFVSGVVPCPLALFVLSFSVAAGVYYVGILSAVVMAIGAALTVGSIGFFALKSREFLDEKLHLGKIKSFGTFLRTGGGLVLIFFGFIMMDLLKV